MAFDPVQLRIDVIKEFAEVSYRYRRETAFAHAYQRPKGEEITRPLILQRSPATPYLDRCKVLVKARKVKAKLVDKRIRTPLSGTLLYEKREYWRRMKANSLARRAP
jgi:hypothetical protein